MNPKSKRKSGSNGLSRRVLGVMGMFTGVQAIGILCSLVKMKLVALWLSATGVGLFSIFTSTIDTISTFTDLGIRQSAVRDIAHSGARGTLARIVCIVRRWSLWAGLLGTLIVSGGAYYLSDLFFGTPDHWPEFLLLSIVMLMNAVINGEQAILQGTQSLKRLASGTTYGTVAGLAISIPMFRYMGEASVAPSIMAYSAAILASLAIVRFRPKNKIRVSISETFREGSSFVRLGIFMALAIFVGNLAHLLFQAYLSRVASTEEVGFFQAGNTLVIRYVGLILSSIGLEFYPRLAAYTDSRKRTELFVSHEICLLSLVITPVVLIFLLARELIVQVLYTSEFMVIIPYISWAVLSCIFRATGIGIGTTIMARGDGHIYIITETVDAIIGLSLNIVFYTLYGLAGIGIAYILWYGIYTLIVSLVYYRRYHLRLSRSAIMMPLLSFATCLAGFVLIQTMPLSISCVYTLAVSALYCYPLLKIFRRS